MVGAPGALFSLGASAKCRRRLNVLVVDPLRRGTDGLSTCCRTSAEDHLHGPKMNAVVGAQTFVSHRHCGIALGIMISIGATHLRDKDPVPIDRDASAGSSKIAELPNPDLRLSRVHLLLSSMK